MWCKSTCGRGEVTDTKFHLRKWKLNLSECACVTTVGWLWCYRNIHSVRIKEIMWAIWPVVACSAADQLFRLTCLVRSFFLVPALRQCSSQSFRQSLSTCGAESDWSQHILSPVSCLPKRRASAAWRWLCSQTYTGLLKLHSTDSLRNSVC